MLRLVWDDYFMEMATLTAKRSTCPRKAVGAVLVSDDHRVLATGYNGSLTGDPHCTEVGCLMVNHHCLRTVHAELNALLQGAKYGVPLAGATLYVTFEPCYACAKAIIQTGITAVHRGEPAPRTSDPSGCDLLTAHGIPVY